MSVSSGQNLKAAGLAGLISLLSVGAVSSCTDVDLLLIPAEPGFRDDKVTIHGELCTASPESRIFPLRVLFVIDSSESMLVTDPPDPLTGLSRRQIAFREAWEGLLEGGPEGVRVGAIRFSSAAQPQTPVDFDMDGLTDTYFTADRSALIAATERLGATDRSTNYLNALSETYLVLRTEFQNAALESLPLSKYVVVFISDGLPDAGRGDRGSTSGQIQNAVQDLRDLARLYRVGTFEFHTAFLSVGEGLVRDQPAQQLLSDMARTGGGTYRNFPGGESLNFLYVDFNVIRRVFTLQTLSVINLNTVTEVEQILDFIPDRSNQVTDGGLGDGGLGDGGLGDGGLGDGGLGDGGLGDGGLDDGGLLPSNLVAPPPNPRLFADVDGDEIPGCGERLVDSDLDGLSDLVEEAIGTDVLVDDTDDDGLKDRLEWSLRSSGLDPLNPGDSLCYLASVCEDEDMNEVCDCLFDSDADGRCDCETNPMMNCADDFGNDCVDSNGDGYCDCPDDDRDGFCDYRDRDRDGMHDCEEAFSGTSPNGLDTDGDGLPDGTEVRYQTNPIAADRVEDADWDLLRNGSEVLATTDPWCDDSAIRSLVAYRYTVDNLGLRGGSTCYAFDIGNITVVPTAPNGQEDWPGNGWNRIMLYAGEVSFDDPDAIATYRVACVMVSYEPDGGFKNPPSGRIGLRNEDFRDLEEFDEARDCIWP